MRAQRADEEPRAVDASHQAASLPPPLAGGTLAQPPRRVKEARGGHGAPGGAPRHLYSGRRARGAAAGRGTTLRISPFVGPFPGPAATVEERVARIARAERSGFPGYWLAGAGLDPLSVFALASRDTESIELGTAVLQAFTRHPVALAQQALTVQLATSGRLALGAGPSHATGMERLGISYERPASRMAEYLRVLRGLLDGDPVDFQGEHYVVRVPPGLRPTRRIPLLTSALAPRMLAIAGELSDGTATWLAGPRTLAERIVPAITAAAGAAGRPAPRILAGVGVAVTEGAGQAAAAREAVSGNFTRYAALPAYARVIDAEGLGSPADLAVIGPEAEVRAGLERLLDAGATEILAAAIPYGDDAADSLDRTEEALAGMLG